MGAALRAEWGKTWSLRSNAGCLAGAVVLVVATSWTLGNDFVVGVGSAEFVAGSTMRPVDAVAPALQFGLLVFAAFAMLTVTSEYTGNTMRTTLRAVPRRWPVLAAKAVVTSSIAATAGLACVAVADALVRVVLAGHTAAGPSVLLTAVRGALVVAMDAVLVVGLAGVVRNSVGTLVTAALLLVGTAALPGGVAAWTPAGAAGALLTGDPDVYPPGLGAVVLACWAALSVTAGTLALLRRDA